MGWVSRCIGRMARDAAIAAAAAAMAAAAVLLMPATAHAWMCDSASVANDLSIATGRKYAIVTANADDAAKHTLTFDEFASEPQVGDTYPVDGAECEIVAAYYAGDKDRGGWETEKAGSLHVLNSQRWRNYSSTITAIATKVKISPRNMDYWFYGCSSLSSLDTSKWDTSAVGSMYRTFQGCSSLSSLDASTWATGSVASMSGLFSSCSSLTALDLTDLDTSSVTDMSSMFSGCTSLTRLDISGFDTSNVTDMSSMFYYCKSLCTIDGLSGLDTGAATKMASMFRDCSSLTSLDASNFDTANAVDMRQMFYYCRSLTALDLTGFDTSSVTDMSSMFGTCPKLTTVRVSDAWDATAVAKSEKMFSGSSALVGGAGTQYDTSHVDAEYARIDDPDNGRPGYFTAKPQASLMAASFDPATGTVTAHAAKQPREAAGSAAGPAGAAASAIQGALGALDGAQEALEGPASPREKLAAMARGLLAALRMGASSIVS